jgi:hypothetical protein
MTCCAHAATILFFGSARAKSSTEYEALLAQLQAQLATTEDRAVRIVVLHSSNMCTNIHVQGVEAQIDRLQAGQWMCAYYDKVREVQLCTKEEQRT